MAYQAVFRRYEQKYLLTDAQVTRLKAAMEGHMGPDRYGSTCIRNLYYDTPRFLLIRRSLERPVYKEKLRLRSYSRADGRAEVFVELKKKYRGVVYKRRVALPRDQAMAWLAGGGYPGRPTQISREIDYVLGFYRELAPQVYLSYDRTAYASTDGSDLRITLDQNICYRTHGLSLGEDSGGEAVLPPGLQLLEVKTAGGLPPWLVNFLSRQKIYKASFSKYGRAYGDMLAKQRSNAYYVG